MKTSLDEFYSLMSSDSQATITNHVFYINNDNQNIQYRTHNVFHAL